jgi:hypothetical protein
MFALASDEPLWTGLLLRVCCRTDGTPAGYVFSVQKLNGVQKLCLTTYLKLVASYDSRSPPGK